MVFWAGLNPKEAPMNNHALLCLMATLVLAVVAGSCSGGNEGEYEIIPGMPDQCLADHYPAPPEGAGTVVYVSAESACLGETADGALESPYGSVAAALAAAEAGATVLVGPGDFMEEECLLVDKPVSLIGMGQYDPETEEYADLTTLGCEAGTLFYVQGTEDVTIQGFSVVEPLQAGVVVSNSRKVTLAHNHISSALQDHNGAFGYGIAVSDSIDVGVEKNVVEKCQSTGIYVQNSVAIIIWNFVALDVEGIRIASCNAEALKMDGSEQPAVEVKNNVLTENYVVGIKVLSSAALIEGNEIGETKALDDQPDSEADGIAVTKLLPTQDNPEPPASKVWIGGMDGDGEGNSITGNGRVGMFMSGNTEVSIIIWNLVHLNGYPGIWLQDSSSAASVEKNTLTENGWTGIGLTTGASANIGGATTDQGNQISSTQGIPRMIGPSTHNIADGIGVFAGSSAAIQNNSIIDNARMGIITDGAVAAATKLMNNTVDGGENGIVVQGQQEGEIPQASISGNVKKDGATAAAFESSVESKFPVFDSNLADPAAMKP